MAEFKNLTESNLFDIDVLKVQLASCPGATYEAISRLGNSLATDVVIPVLKHPLVGASMVFVALALCARLILRWAYRALKYCYRTFCSVSYWNHRWRRTVDVSNSPIVGRRDKKDETVLDLRDLFTKTILTGPTQKVRVEQEMGLANSVFYPKEGTPPGQTNFPGLCAIRGSPEQGNELVGMCSRVKFNGGTVLKTALHVWKEVFNAPDGTFLLECKGKAVKLSPEHAIVMQSGVKDLDFVLVSIPESCWSVIGASIIKVGKFKPGFVQIYGFKDGVFGYAAGRAQFGDELFEIKHHCSTWAGFSGSPLFNGNKMVGMHRGAIRADNVNLGTTSFMLDTNFDVPAEPLTLETEYYGYNDWRRVEELPDGVIHHSRIETTEYDLDLQRVGKFYKISAVTRKRGAAGHHTIEDAIDEMEEGFQGESLGFLSKLIEFETGLNIPETSQVEEVKEIEEMIPLSSWKAMQETLVKQFNVILADTESRVMDEILQKYTVSSKEVVYDEFNKPVIERLDLLKRQVTELLKKEKLGKVVQDKKVKVTPEKGKQKPVAQDATMTAQKCGEVPETPIKVKKASTTRKSASVSSSDESVSKPFQKKGKKTQVSKEKEQVRLGKKTQVSVENGQVKPSIITTPSRIEIQGVEFVPAVKPVQPVFHKATTPTTNNSSKASRTIDGLQVVKNALTELGCNTSELVLTGLTPQELVKLEELSFKMRPRREVVLQSGISPPETPMQSEDHSSSRVLDLIPPGNYLNSTSGNVTLVHFSRKQDKLYNKICHARKYQQALRQLTNQGKVLLQKATWEFVLSADMPSNPNHLQDFLSLALPLIMSDSSLITRTSSLEQC